MQYHSDAAENHSGRLKNLYCKSERDRDDLNFDEKAQSCT